MSNNANDVINIACNEVGYSRWNDPETGTKYGRWYADLVGESYYGASGVPYCAMFVSWCFNQAGASCAGLPGAYCPSILSAGKSRGRTVSKSEGQYGDAILFDWGGDGVADHIGLIISNEGSYFKTVEGNTNNGCVCYRTRSYDSVIGIIRPNYGEEVNISSSGTISNSSSNSNGCYSYGSSGSKVIEIQQALINKGYSCGSYGADGDFGSYTRSAVISFQSDHGLEVDGIVGPNTMAALFEDNSSPQSTSIESNNYSNMIDEDGLWGEQTTRALQNLLGTGVDGVISGQLSAYHDRFPGIVSSWEWLDYNNGWGSNCIRELQNRIGAESDGFFGPASCRQLQQYLGTTVDGTLDYPSECIKTLQQHLNNRNL